MVLETHQWHICHLLHSAVTIEYMKGHFDEAEDSELLVVPTWQDVIALYLIVQTYWHQLPLSPPPHRLHTSLCLPSPLSLKYRVFLLPSSYMTKVNCPVTWFSVSDMSDYLLTLRVKVFHRYWWNCNVVLHVVVFMNRKIKIRCRRIAAHTKGTFQWRHREKCLWVLALSAGPWYSPLQLTLTVFLCTYFCV